MFNMHSFCVGVCRACVCMCECMFCLKFYLEVKLKICALVPGRNAAACFLGEKLALLEQKQNRYLASTASGFLSSFCWKLKKL